MSAPRAGGSWFPVGRVVPGVRLSAANGVPALPRRGPVALLVGALLLVLARFDTLLAATPDVSSLPAPAAITVDYVRDIRPILEASCLSCHAGERPKSRYRLTDRDSAIRGGAVGKAIEPGNSATSPLIWYVAGLDEEMLMPPSGKGERLTPEEIALLRAWIDQGVSYAGAGAGTPVEPLLTITPGLQWIGVDGNTRKFREHTWMSDGASGGMDHFEWQEPVGKDGRLKAEGRAWVGSEDYDLKLSYDRRDVGFIRGGYGQFRRWYDDTGGYYEPFGIAPYQVGRDLYIDNGRAWFEIGLARPDVPRMTLGYDYIFREGERSTLQWGPVFDPTSGEMRAIYPATKQVDETIHRIRFDFDHTVAGLRIEDNFRGEFADLQSDRTNVDSYTLGSVLPDVSTRYRDGFQYFQGANTLRLEKPVTDWLLVNGGFLYSNLEGDGSFSSETFIPSDPSMGPFAGPAATDLVLRREAYVFNANSQAGPWEDFTLAAGVQADWSRQEGFGTATISDLPSPLDTNLDRFAVGEHVTLKYTGIPWTVLHANAQLQQESLGQYEQQSLESGFPDAREFLRDTDASNDLWDLRAGFTVSPWTRVSFDGGYRHRQNDTSYDHLQDVDASDTPGNGYPAFIRGRDVAADEVSARVVWQAARWLKTSLKYQLVSSTIDTETDDVLDPASGALLGGGWLKSGQHDAHVYSLNATFAPWRRLFLNTTFSFSDARTSTGVDSPSVVPYAGQIYTVLTTATYALDTRTTAIASYAFSKADYGQDNFADGLPLGIIYDRHALLAGLRREFKKGLTAHLNYGFFLYEEPTSAGAADYTAHGVFLSLSKRFR